MFRDINLKETIYLQFEEKFGKNNHFIVQMNTIIKLPSS